jgi:ribosomal protein S18 acetylase RimI-like enzyme
MSTALRFSRIETEQQPRLLQEIHNILTEVGAHNVEIYNQAYWDWQYKNLPSGKSLVYAAWDDDKIIGYYHVPVYKYFINGEEKLIGNIQDVAVNPKYRGVGLFRQLAEFANADLDTSEVELIYTFPNDKSIRTFLKYNCFKQVSRVPAYIRPIRSGGILKSKVNLFGLEQIVGWIVDLIINLFTRSMNLTHASVELVTEVSDELTNLFTEYNSSFENHLVRDKAWLDWRYLKSIRGKHHIFAIRESGKLTATIVLKEDEMLNNPSLLVLDFACKKGKEESLLSLINQVQKQPKLTGFKSNLIFISGLAPVLTSLGSIGFFKIPEKLNPRVLNLLTRSSSNLDESTIMDENNWLLTLGEWDVF